jgi:integrase
MPRKATGTLVNQGGHWFGRYWAMVDGERVRRFVDLDTQNELRAKQTLAKLVAADEAGVEADGVELVAQAGDRIIGDRERLGQSPRGERSYFVRYVVPVLGHMPVTAVSKGDVLSVLEAARDAGRAGETIAHLKKSMSAVFKQLRREEVISELPIPTNDELPEALPETIDDRAKSVLSDDELLIYLSYTDARKGERYAGATRERQLMSLLSRCVGGMRTIELHGLTWGRVRAEEGTFDALEVLRTKTRRKASRRGSKAVSRQLYPLGDTVLPFFLRYWYVRTSKVLTSKVSTSELSPADPLFPVRRLRVRGHKRPNTVRSPSSTWASSLRRDLMRAFEAAHAKGVPGVPKKGSRRWAELFEGTGDRQRLIFHSSRNAAAVVAERFERLRAAARFTGHASGQMLQHYRERVGEVDVVPIFPELLPDASKLVAIVRSWCDADGIAHESVFGPEPTEPDPDGSDDGANEKADGKGRALKSSRVTARRVGGRDLLSVVMAPDYEPLAELRRPLLYPTELRGQGQITHRFQALVVPR